MQEIRRNFNIKMLKEPLKEDLEQDIEWLCKSLGFAGERDKENTSVEILKLLIKSSKNREGLTSDGIAEKIKPTRGAVVHHLNKFMRRGLVVKVNNKYELRMNSLEKTLEEIKLDINRTISNILSIAKDVDSKIGIKARQ
jgi:predicted transcriptional regulator